MKMKKKRPHNVMHTNNPDGTPGSSKPQKKRKVTAGARSGEVARQVSADKERRRLQQVSAEKIVAKLMPPC